MTRLKLWLLLAVVVCLTGSVIGCGGAGAGSPGTPDFALSAAPSSVTLKQGGSSVSSTITVNPADGFSGSVSLSVSGVPSGVTASFNPGSTSSTSTLTLTAAGNAPTGAATITVTGVSGSLTHQTTISLSVGQITHVVIIVQENRTPDNLFQGLCTFAGSPGCDPTGTNQSQYNIASKGKTSTGQTVPLTPVPLVTNYDLGHSHAAFLDICDYNSSTGQCAMDGADKDVCDPAANCPNMPAFQYVQPSDVQPYLTMATTYAFGDQMFQTNQGDSFPAHQYILSGTSRVCVPEGVCPQGITTSITIADNPGNDNDQAGCLAPPGATINAVDLSQPFPQSPFSITQLCLEHPTLTDLLENATPPISWKYYTPTAGSIWTAPDAIQHICVPEPPYPSASSQCTGSDWTNHVVLEQSGAVILTDISSGNLAAVSWVIPTGANSDHADNPQDNGPSWVSSIVNAIGESQYWANTAIIVTWDDWGGWYDHVPPPTILNSYEYGLRVPIVVISPYAKAKYISHQVNDFGSILKFIENTFALTQPIDFANSIPFADQYALGDLSDFFNFSQTPLPFTEIPAALKADHFLNDKSPPTPPDTD